MSQDQEIKQELERAMDGQIRESARTMHALIAIALILDRVTRTGSALDVRVES